VKQICLLSGILLLLGITSFFPYSYYQILRLIIFFTGISVAYGFYSSKLTGWSIVFAVIAIVFNPLVPLYLQKSSWVGIDFISAILFLLAGYSIRKETHV
jgi:hypothetical protein